jgi:hypothetical protein
LDSVIQVEKYRAQECNYRNFLIEGSLESYCLIRR